jgi:hypothetical protein
MTDTSLATGDQVQLQKPGVGLQVPTLHSHGRLLWLPAPSWSRQDVALGLNSGVGERCLPHSTTQEMPWALEAWTETASALLTLGKHCSCKVSQSFPLLFTGSFPSLSMEEKMLQQPTDFPVLPKPWTGFTSGECHAELLLLSSPPRKA